LNKAGAQLIPMASLASANPNPARIHRIHAMAQGMEFLDRQ
jgi:hypothetical protein